MTADVETMMSAREVPWHGMGTVVEQELAAADALVAAGLDWRVSKVPMFTGTGGMTEPEPGKKQFRAYDEVGGYYAVQRETDKVVLGVVGAPYTPLQNAEAFAFMDALVDSGDAHWETAGSLRGGKWVFMTMKLPREIKVGGEDPVDLYLALFNSHDGSRAITGMVTPVRIVCTNTLNLALSGARRKWTVRHLSTMDGKLMEARRQLDLTFEYADAFESQMDELAQRPFSDSQFENLVSQLRTTPQVSEGLLEAWASGEHGRSNRWDALNAVGEFYDWLREPRTANSQLMGSWFGQGVKARDNALKILTAA